MSRKSASRIEKAEIRTHLWLNSEPPIAQVLSVNHMGWSRNRGFTLNKGRQRQIQDIISFRGRPGFRGQCKTWHKGRRFAPGLKGNLSIPKPSNTKHGCFKKGLPFIHSFPKWQGLPFGIPIKPTSKKAETATSMTNSTLPCHRP